MSLSIQVRKKNNEYTASCPELEIFCYGKDEAQAKKRLKKVIQFYAETASELGYDLNLDHLPLFQKEAQTQQSPKSTLYH